ncbi:hypothetical protein MIMGU_mgv11b016146mg [Erythranthe guttata]|uniref:F-box/LRR-repeat protein 15/At3g58940/PEG3-like LRR domain-containing protein n=1 Tax=Erythranthe guttata TaxID=4155 RepID=A0A022QVE8_ERYGU|nr:hypothetical protein MIMGU_mgv11b016146mg [Erythranthe guttata]
MKRSCLTSKTGKFKTGSNNQNPVRPDKTRKTAKAVRTSVLSKSWRSIWCTRPNLDFSIQAFEGNKQDFITTVDNTLQRYLDQRLCIEEFSLRVSIGGDDDEESMPALEQWIRLVTNMGLKELRLQNSTEDYKYNHLPSVVFEAESLKYLYLDQFIVDQTTIRRILLLKNLKSLDLQRVSIKDDIFEKIILSCPLVETLAVRNCRTLTTIDATSLQNLKKFTFVNDNVPFVDDCRIKIHTPSLEVINCNGGCIPFLRGADFRNLTRLSLTGVVSRFDHLSTCKFPILEILIIFDCCGFEEIKLFIDAPKINNFDYFGDFIPSISFATTTSSSEWRSTIHLHSIDVFSSLWFVKGNELLKSLSQSIISLNIDQCYRIRENIMVQDKNVKPVVVDSLGLRFDLSSISSLMNALFCVCRPRFIDDSFFCGSGWKMDHIKCLWNILLMRREFRRKNQLSQLWFRDLEELRLVIHDKNKNEWRPITLSQWPHYRQRQGEDIITRIVLKWRQTL